MQHSPPESFYAEHPKLVDTISTMLLERLAPLNLQPTSILLNTPTMTQFNQIMCERYPQADIVHLNLDPTTDKPMPANQFDLVIVDLAWCWCDDIQAMVTEARRVIKTQGTILITTLGPNANQDLHTDTLKTCDMHDLGDLLLSAGFIDPVMDVEHLTTEVIFGYARGPKQASYQTEDGEVAIPISRIQRSNTA